MQDEHSKPTKKNRRGEHLSRSHQIAAALLPRPGSLKAEAVRKPGESLDEATLRLQVARADTEELDRQKRELELRKARGELVTKEEAVDLAQAAVLRVCQILDLIPERLRDRLPPELHAACDHLSDVIHEARTEIGTNASA